METTNKKIKKLQLNKEVISNLNNSNFIQGGNVGDTKAPPTHHGGTLCGTNFNTCLLTCDKNGGHCDFPTIGDSCFTLCKTKCNDY